MDSTAIRGRVQGLLQEFPSILDTKVGGYFAETSCEGLSHEQQRLIAEKSELNLHELMLWGITDDATEGFRVLAEIDRYPMNHLDALYEFYWAAQAE